jgi:hypothetical protein
MNCRVLKLTSKNLSSRQRINVDLCRQQPEAPNRESWRDIALLKAQHSLVLAQSYAALEYQGKSERDVIGYVTTRVGPCVLTAVVSSLLLRNYGAVEWIRAHHRPHSAVGPWFRGSGQGKRAEYYFFFSSCGNDSVLVAEGCIVDPCYNTWE